MHLVLTIHNVKSRCTFCIILVEYTFLQTYIIYIGYMRNSNYEITLL